VAIHQPIETAAEPVPLPDFHFAPASIGLSPTLEAGCLIDLVRNFRPIDGKLVIAIAAAF
jgi:hypothetical protein